MATLRNDVIEVLDTLAWAAPVIVGHCWGGHLLLHVLVAAPERVGAALVVATVGALGDGGMAELEAEVLRGLPQATLARLEELDHIEGHRPLTTPEVLEGMALVWPGYFSSLGVAQPIAQTGHALSEESWASIRSELPGLADKLRGCAVPAPFVHGELDPLPVWASITTAELMGAPVDLLEGNGHFPWLENPGCVRHSLDLLVAVLG